MIRVARTRTGMIAIGAISAGAMADITSIGEFSSLSFEGFDDERWVFETNAQDIMGGIGQVFAEDSGWIHTTNSWILSGQYSTNAYDGSMLGNTRGGISYTFGTSQYAFGGFFATISDTADGVIRFYSGDTMLGESTVSARVGGEWTWSGWSVADGFDRIEVVSNYNDGAGGFLMHDSVRVSNQAIPAPGAIACFGIVGIAMARRRRS